MLVVDKSGQIRDVPYDEGMAAYTKGEVGIVPDQPVAVQHPDTGEVQTLPAAQLEDAISQGFAPASRGELHAQVQKTALEGPLNTAAAVAAGHLRGLSLGVSDAALGNEDQFLSGLQEAHPTASTLGELGGMANGLLLGSGEGALGKTLSAPTRLMTGAGDLAETGVRALTSKLGTGLAARAVEKIGTSAARGAAESAVLGAGQAITESVIENKDLSAESIMHHAISNALLGAGIGAGIGALGAGKNAFSKLLAPGEEASTAGARVAGEGGEGAAGARVNWLDKARSVMSGDTPEEVAFLHSAEGRRLANANPNKFFDEQSYKAQKAYDRAFGDDAIDDEVWKRRNAEMARKIPEEQMPAMQKAFLGDEGVFDRLHDELESMKIDPKNNSRVLQAMEKRLKDFKESALAAKTPGELYKASNDLKQEWGNFAKRAGNEAYGAERQYMEILRPPLEDPAIMGDAAAAHQREINAAASAYIGPAKGASRAVEANTWEHAGEHGFQFKYEADPGKMRGILSRAGTPDSYMDLKVLNSAVDARIQFLDAAAKHNRFSPDMLGRIAKQREGAVEWKKMLAESVDQSAKMRQIQAMAARKAGAVTGALGKIPVIGGGFTAFASPVATARTRTQFGEFLSRLGLINNMTGTLEGKVSHGVSGLLSTAGAGAVKHLPAAAARVLGSTSAERKKNFEKQRNAVIALASSPDQIGSHLRPLDEAAPETTGKAQFAMHNAAKFLASKLPQAPQGGPTLQPRIAAQHAQVSDSDMAHWARYVSAVVDPTSALDDARRGQLTHEQVEALKATSPATYDQIVRATREKIAELDARGKPLSYDQRITLSSLLDTPADPSRDPAVEQSLQQVYAGQGSAPTPQPQGKAPQRAPISGISKIKTTLTKSASERIGSELT